MIIGRQILEDEVCLYLQTLDHDAMLFIGDQKVKDTLPPDFFYFVEGNPHLWLELNEHSKNLSTVELIWSFLATSGAKRKSIVVIMGGGTLTDLAGFASATYMRGLRTIHLSTTLLGMVDASLGGKTGIDYSGVKNLIGSFHEPIEVILDTAFLDTLPIDELYSGYGEIIKTALLEGGELWEFVSSVSDIQACTDDEWLYLIQKCAEYKLRIVRDDPEECNGLRSSLNLGHTVAHALEAYSKEQSRGKPLLHGEAVVIGLIVEGYLAYKHLGLDKQVLRQLITLTQRLYRPYYYTCKAYPRLLELMSLDKKNVALEIRFTLLTSLGVYAPWSCTNKKEIEEALDFYREVFGQ